ncbi:hypothetical protein ACQKWADRAFT_307764 [Trichoderma austrokoningii]
MQKQQKRIPSSSHEASHHCPLCKKTFNQESSRNRHYYYCRSKLPDTNKSRRRSCAACVRAKTRCIVPGDAISESCIRCHDRSAECEFVVSHRSDVSNATRAAGKSLGPQGSEATTLALAKRSGRSANLETTGFPQGSPHPSASIEWPTGDTRDAGSSGFHLSMCEIPLYAELGIEPLVIPRGEELGVVDSGISALAPWNLSGSSLFEPRTFAKPCQGSLALLALQILRSYPFMMLQKAALPPFINPLQASWVENGVGPRQQPLLACIALVSLFKSRTDSGKQLVWRLIKLEQEKLLSKHVDFDKWELLAAFQALLVYCLLRIQEVPVDEGGFDPALLTTVNLVFNALTSSTGGARKSELPDDPGVTWMDWIFNESRRRTVLIFQILSILIEMSTEASSYLTCGFVLIPLANGAALWNASGIDEWKTEFEISSKEPKVHGLLQTGVLMKLLLTDDSMALTSVGWENWRAEVGEIGTLVMIIGALLNPART